MLTTSSIPHAQKLKTATYNICLKNTEAVYKILYKIVSEIALYLITILNDSAMKGYCKRQNYI